MKSISHFNINFTKLKHFFESKYFLLFLASITLVSWIITTYVKASFLFSIPYIILCIILILMLIVKSKFYSLCALMMFFMAGNGKIPVPIENKIPLTIIALFALPVLILVIKRFIENWSINNKIFLNPLLVIQIIMSIVMFISIINSPVKFKSLGLTLLFMINILISIIVLQIDVEKEKFKKYLTWSAIIFMLVTSTQFLIKIFVRYMELQEFSLLLESLRKKDLELCWALANHFVVIINMGIAFSIYRFFRTESNKEKVFVSLFAIYGLISVILTFSRGGYLGLSVLLFVMLIVILIGNKQKNTLLIFFVTAIVMLIAMILVLKQTGTLDFLIKYFKEMGISENGRDRIRQYAIRLFKENWLFGTGWGTSKYYNDIYFDQKIYNYHNYILQASTAGIFSIIAFFVYIIIVLNLCMKKHFFQLTVLSITCMFLVHGWVDTLYYNRLLMPYYTLFVSSCIIFNNSKKSDKLLL